MYANPDAAPPPVQIARLSADIENARAKGIAVPPGVHAHLGYMYLLQGNEAAAVDEFSSERELYPESAVFIDGLLKKLHANHH